MVTVKATCDECKKRFQQRKADYRRAERRGWHHFCSRKCSAHWGHRNFPHGGGVANFKGKRKYQKPDSLSSFRFFQKAAKANSEIRVAYTEVTITPEYLKQIWENQQGLCPFTKWNLTLPLTACTWPKDSPRYKRASLDRIDNSKGYIPGNVRFVCMMINFAKNSFDDDVLGEFLDAIAANRMK